MGLSIGGTADRLTRTINTDPATGNIGIGGPASLDHRVHVEGDIHATGDLSIDGTTTTINSVTLTVDDKNIELASTSSPTDASADGGGIVLKGTTDKTWLWNLEFGAWESNQPIRTGNLELKDNTLRSTNVNGDIVLSPNGTGKVTIAGVITAGQLDVDNLRLDGNTLSSQTGDLDVTTQTGGVFKFTSNAFQAGQDSSNYLEIGHGGSNSFVNSVGSGEMDFRFGGVNKASFTPAGHLHLKTDTDQKHNLKIITANNANDSGIAWENSGGNFSQTIFRTDVGSNRSDLVFAIGSDANIDLLTNSFKIHGSAANEGRLEILGTFQISSGSPGLNKVATSDAIGIVTWVLPSGGGWTDSGANVFLTNINDKVGIGEAGPDTKFHVADGGTAGSVTPFAGTIATLESPGAGYLSILSPDASESGILFGEPSSNIAGSIRYNTAGTLDGLEFRVDGNFTAMSVERASVTIPSQLNVDNLRLDGNNLSSTDTNGDITLAPNGTGDIVLSTATNAQTNVKGTPGQSVGGFPSGQLHVTSPSTSVNGNSVITGHNSFNGNTQLWYFGSVSSSNQNIAIINRQNAEVHIHTNDLNRVTVQAGGNVGVNETNPSEKFEVNGNIKANVIIDDSIYAQLSSSVDQNPGDTNPTVITYNTQDAIAGLTHSTTVLPGEITIDTAGTYFVSPQPQVGKTTGGAKVDFDMFLQVDRGGGFADEVNSNIKLTIKDADITDVIVSAFTIELSVGDKIRMMQKTSATGAGMGLKNTDAVVGPPTVPRTPAIIFSMYRVGGLAA